MGNAGRTVRADILTGPSARVLYQDGGRFGGNTCVRSQCIGGAVKCNDNFLKLTFKLSKELSQHMTKTLQTIQVRANDKQSKMAAGFGGN